MAEQRGGSFRGGLVAPQAQDAFASVRCTEDIPKALIGKTVPKGPTSVTEGKHRDIGLKNEGAMIISDILFSGGWTMCGREYELLLDKGLVIRDALLFVHSRSLPGFIGTCENDGRKLADAVYVATLKVLVPVESGHHYDPTDTTLVPAVSAWRIDETRARFVKVAVDRLLCPLNGIFTVDGGL